MAKKKTFEISNSLAQALGETISAAKNYSGDLNIDVVPLSKIELDPDNPRELALTYADLYDGILTNDPEYDRKVEEKENLETIAHSIQKQGVLNPIIVYKFGNKYRLITGERRTLASVLCKKESIQAKILEKKPSPTTLGVLQWIENVEREDLTLWERLRNIEKIISAMAEEIGKITSEITVTDISKVIGCSLQLAANYKNVLDAPSKLKILVQNNKIKNLEKAALISRSTPDKQDGLIQACLLGANLKELRRLSEKKSDKISLKRRVGRQASCVNFGITKNIHAAKLVIELIVENEHFRQLKTKLVDINWDDFSEVSLAFKELIKEIELQAK